MTTRMPRRDRPAPRGVRRFERWVVGVVMAIIAYVVEKTVLRSIRRGTTSPTPSAQTVLTGTGAEVTTD